MSAGTEYAVCLDCPATFDDSDAVRAHADETMRATGETGVTSRSHSWRVINPTPEEQTKNRIRGVVSDAIEDALRDAMDNLQSAVDGGDLTTDELRDELCWYPDFRDAWDEYTS